MIHRQLGFPQIHFYLSSNVSSAATFIVTVVLYFNNFFFTAISKSVITYITLTQTCILNNIIKQHYGIAKTRKNKKFIAKRNSLAELIFLFRTGLSHLIIKFSLISRTFLRCPSTKMVNSSEDRVLLQIPPSFDCLAFLNVMGDTQYVLQT